MKRLAIALTLALFAAPTAVHAQQGNRPDGAPGIGMSRQNPAELVVGKADEFALTLEQIERLNALAAQFHERDAGRRDEMRAAMRSRMQERSADRERTMERREAMIREAEADREQVLALLSDTQREKLRAIFEEREPRRPLRP